MIIIGTRGSALALAQARLVAERLGPDAEIRVLRTAGDVSDRPIRELGDGVFVTAIEEALRAGGIDVAVHSLKDLPTDEPADLLIAAIPEREDPRDVLLARGRDGLAGLRAGAVVGTSSPRRAAFLHALRPDATAREIRGNVDTRLRKVREGEYDAVLVAAAGLRRLGIAFDEREALPVELCPPAPGQGALAVQIRAGDGELRARIAPLDDRATRLAVTAERALLRLLGASCEIPLGAIAHVVHGDVVLDAALADTDGVRRAAARGRDPHDVARRAAEMFGVAAHV
ncbi:MAG TPA: hydroxymethylbilane synthase [Candidatus Limnocylindria bacterium]|nr:hydroxymethylbilane synthase [Candidatus Limnocylindria bacterium]